MSWVTKRFQFNEDQKSQIFAGVRIGTPVERAAFIRAVEGAITANKEAQRIQPDVLKRRSTAVRDTARKMLEVIGDGMEAGFTPEQLQQARELMEQADIHATATVDRLNEGGRPDAQGKALAAWIRDAYRQAFRKQPSLDSGSAFEKLLGNIAAVCSLPLPTDPRLLKQSKTPQK